MNENEAATKVVSGLVEYVTFHNAENGFCVLRVKARGHRNLVSIVGHVASISVGEWITASGEWFDDGKFGMQFKARFLKTSAPESVEGIQKYLESGMINGIGPIYAQKLINTFGKNVFDIIETAPERLRDVDGIGPIRAKKITKAWANQKAIREIMIFLHQHGVGTARAVRIFKTYHNDAIQVMSENPYRMTRDIRGIGFRTADAIAKKFGIEKTSKIRARAGLSFALHESMKNGHCGLPRETLCKLSQELLDLPQDVVQSALDAELLNKTVTADTIADTECIFLTGLYLAEQSIADHIRRIQTRTMPWAPIDTDNALPWVERKIGISLAKNQVKAVSHALKSKVMVITGGPGVGKTTILNAILRILNAKSVRIKLCAPTGRAAKRMSEATGMTAKTIHRLLEFNPSEFKFMRNAHSPLKCDLLVIDESSMVDVRLMKSLLEAIPSTAALFIVGDIDQLPSVGPGQVLADIIRSGTVRVVRLTEVFRQATESKIIMAAHQINAGILPDLQSESHLTDFYFISSETPQQTVQTLREVITRRIPDRFGLNPTKDIQVLCPMNRGVLGAYSLNQELQAVLNPDARSRIEKFGWTFLHGDKVMQTENDYEKDVFNGDIGLVEHINQNEDEITIKFDERKVQYNFGELDSLVPAYAITIHKSQGSEYPAVVIPIMTQHYPMLQRNLIYTGVTRGKNLVVLIGQEKALRISVSRASVRRRWTRLNQWLTDTNLCNHPQRDITATTH